MKTFGLLIGMALASIGSVSAQLTVDVVLDQDQFLSGEALNVDVRITNRSGESLRLGTDNRWLTFTIESKDHFLVSRKGDVPVEGEFTLDSSKRASKQVDIVPYFAIDHPGHYSVSATVMIPGWPQPITSAPQSFDIIQGAKLWEQEFGVPKPADAAGSAPEVRRYVLQQANFVRRQLMLYVRVTDATGKVYRIFPIGPMLSFGQPEAQIDKSSNLHVLYQDGPHSFNYTVVNPDGSVVIRQRYDYTSRPRLKVDDDDGRIKVVGGMRRVMASDVPAPQIADDNAPTSQH